MYYDYHPEVNERRYEDEEAVREEIEEEKHRATVREALKEGKKGHKCAREHCPA
jgi:hypothetical protein